MNPTHKNGAGMAPAATQGVEASSRSGAGQRRRPSAAARRRDGMHMHASTPPTGIAKAARNTRRNRTKQRNIADDDEAAAAAVASASTAMEEEEVTSAPVAAAKNHHAALAIGSPLRTPCTTSSSHVAPKFPNVRESADKIVLGAAKFLLGLSSYVDGTLLKQCSGFLIDWSENNKSGTVLTSAHLICWNSAPDEWSGEQEYAPDAEVRVHLNDGIAVRGQLMYYHKHYGFAPVSVHMDRPALLACFSKEEVRFGQDVFVIGRDERLFLRISNGRVDYDGPSVYARYHYMYITGGEAPDCCIGGPVVDFDGAVIGMTNFNGFIPSSIINKCLHLWRRYGCIPRLHLGLKLSAVKFLDFPEMEEIYGMSDIVNTGLIVKEVSEGSIAEKHGVKKGDIVKSLNGQCVDTTAALENMILSTCIDHFDNGHGLGSSMDVTVGVFFTRGAVHGDINFTAKVSNDVEVFATGTYSEDHYTSMPPKEANEDDTW